MCGTPEYMAPEVISKVGHGSAVDWWGLGAITFEMLTGLPPWFTKDRQKLFTRIRFASLPTPEFLGHECQSFIGGLLQRNPRDRLGVCGGFDTLKNHPFFFIAYSVSPFEAESWPRGYVRESAAETFSWAKLAASELTPPISPMRGAADDQKNVYNVDECFTKLEVNEAKEQSTSSTTHSKDGEVAFPHFQGFSFFADDGDDSDGSFSDDSEIARLEQELEDLKAEFDAAKESDDEADEEGKQQPAVLTRQPNSSSDSNGGENGGVETPLFALEKGSPIDNHHHQSLGIESRSNPKRAAESRPNWLRWLRFLA